MTKATEKTIGTPTANGVIKGRPGKGRVLSLEQRKRCYAGHAMTEENTFRYTAKRVKGQPNPIERAWCKKCRATSRKASAEKRRLREAKEEAQRKRETKASAKPSKGKAATRRAVARMTEPKRSLATTPTARATKRAKAAKAARKGTSGQRAA